MVELVFIVWIGIQGGDLKHASHTDFVTLNIITNKYISRTDLLFFTLSVSVTKASVDQNDTGSSKLKKKLKKKRLKEKASKQCSNEEPEAVEPHSKTNAADNGKTSKQGTGMLMIFRLIVKIGPGNKEQFSSDVHTIVISHLL